VLTAIQHAIESGMTRYDLVVVRSMDTVLTEDMIFAMYPEMASKADIYKKGKSGGGPAAAWMLKGVSRLILITVNDPSETSVSDGQLHSWGCELKAAIRTEFSAGCSSSRHGTSKLMHTTNNTHASLAAAAAVWVEVV
jgi:hypothetical protein